MSSTRMTKKPDPIMEHLLDTNFQIAEKYSYFFRLKDVMLNDAEKVKSQERLVFLKEEVDYGNSHNEKIIHDYGYDRLVIASQNGSDNPAQICLIAKDFNISINSSIELLYDPINNTNHFADDESTSGKDETPVVSARTSEAVSAQKSYANMASRRGTEGTMSPITTISSSTSVEATESIKSDSIKDKCDRVHESAFEATQSLIDYFHEHQTYAEMTHLQTILGQKLADCDPRVRTRLSAQVYNFCVNTITMINIDSSQNQQHRPELFEGGSCH